LPLPSLDADGRRVGTRRDRQSGSVFTGDDLSECRSLRSLNTGWRRVYTRRDRQPRCSPTTIWASAAPSGRLTPA